MGSTKIENLGGVNENRILFVIRCESFYEMEERAKKVAYDDRDLTEMTRFEDLRNGFKWLNIRQTNYDRVPLTNNPVLKCPSEAGYHGASIKFLCRLANGSKAFFFAYGSYSQKVGEYQHILKQHCEVLQQKEEFKVDRWDQVQLSNLFVLKSKKGNIFLRVRIVQINRNTMKIGCWAVDEGFLVDCEPNDLMFLNDYCTSLEMLAVPGVFAADPTPAQLEKFERGNYCIAQVMQPKLAFDSAPRKVILN